MCDSTAGTTRGTTAGTTRGTTHGTPQITHIFTPGARDARGGFAPAP